ncbi:hypothetical protein [Burkholderia lata]|nr:hypothetical protein [Burkholderia lata]
MDKVYRLVKLAALALWGVVPVFLIAVAYQHLRIDGFWSCN